MSGSWRAISGIKRSPIPCFSSPRLALSTNAAMTSSCGKLSSINDQVADILVRLAQRQPLDTIVFPEKEKEEPKEEVILQPTQPVKPIIEEEPEKKKTDAIPYAVSIALALALMGGLVMKEKMRIDYINNQPEMRLHNFITKAKKKGHKLHDIRKVLVRKGWPEHMVDSVSLHDAISILLKKGHNHSMIREILKSKGLTHNIIDDSIINNYINKNIKKRKGIKKIRSELLKAGWNKKLVDKKIPTKIPPLKKDPKKMPL